jgi:low affinity Fe/Cu permease
MINFIFFVLIVGVLYFVISIPFRFVKIFSKNDFVGIVLIIAILITSIIIGLIFQNWLFENIPNLQELITGESQESDTCPEELIGINSDSESGPSSSMCP